jgi:hypothetical protein
MADETITVKLDSVEPFARFVAQAARADAYFFALTADEIKALPRKAVRGLMALRKAFDEFGQAVAAEPFALRSAERLDPIAYEDPAGD